MKFKVEFDLDNATFQGGEGALGLNVEAISETLREIANKLGSFGWEIVRDINGNKIGNVQIVGVEPQ